MQELEGKELQHDAWHPAADHLLLRGIAKHGCKRNVDTILADSNLGLLPVARAVLGGTPVDAAQCTELLQSGSNGAAAWVSGIVPRLTLPPGASVVRKRRRDDDHSSVASSVAAKVARRLEGERPPAVLSQSAARRPGSATAACPSPGGAVNGKAAEPATTAAPATTATPATTAAPRSAEPVAAAATGAAAATDAAAATHGSTGPAVERDALPGTPLGAAVVAIGSPKRTTEHTRCEALVVACRMEWLLSRIAAEVSAWPPEALKFAGALLPLRNMCLPSCACGDGDLPPSPAAFMLTRGVSCERA